MDDSSIEPVQVFVRIRPEIAEDTVVSELNGSRSRHKCVAGLDGHTLRVDPPDAQGRKAVSAVDSKLYSYDTVFGEGSTQEDIYSSVSHHVRATIRGYNTTIFALGCTGSGKTFTMSGNSANPGIVPRAISEIFSMIEATAAEEKDVYFYVRLSLVELYNNNFRNLLDFASKELSDKDFKDTTMSHMSMRGNSPTSLHPSISSRSEKIEVRESQSAGVFLAGHNLRIPVTTAQEAFQLIARGTKNRATGATNCNDVSSRSHCILTIHVESRVESSPQGGKSELRLGKMHLVDLAGSERLKLSGAEGDTLTETQNINLSLKALGDVLAALSHNAKDHSRVATGKQRSPSKAPFAMMPVPYRNSKLTHLLKDSLGGNSKTTMITTICTLTEYYQQTLISLNYASRAKKVKNRSLVNRDVIGDSGIHAVTSEIERLRARLDERTSEFDRLKADQQRDASENTTLKLRMQKLNEVNENEKRQLEAQMSNVIHNQAGQLAAQRQRISTLQTALQDELALSQNRIAEQEKEIHWLKQSLHESAQAIQQPTEQLQRMQKVIDAWQEQADTTQEELREATAVADESRTKLVAMRAEITNVQAERDSLREELDVWPRREAQLQNALSKEKEEAAALITKTNALSKKNTELKSSVASLMAEAKNRELHYSDSAQRSSQLESELRAQLTKAEKRIIELTLKNEEVELQNDELRTRLSSTMSVMERQLLSVVDDSKSSVKQNEFRAEVAEKRAKSMEAELDMFKKKITAMQNDTHDIISQRDVKISTIWSELQESKSAVDHLKSDYERRLGDSDRTVSDLQSQLTVAQRTVEDLRAASARQAEEFAASLEARAIEVSELKKSYSDVRSTVHEEYEKKVSEIRHTFESKISVVSESKTEECKAFKIEIEQKYKSEVESLSAQLRQLQESSSTTVQSLRSKHDSEIKEIVSEWKQRFSTVTEDLRSEHEKETTELRLRLKAENDELAEKHSIELEQLRDSLSSSHDEADSKATALFEARRTALETDTDNKMRAMEHEHQVLLAEELEKCTSKLRKEHRSELQLLRAQHLELLQDMDQKYTQNAAEVRTEVEVELATEFAKKEQLLKADLANAVDTVKAEAAAAVREGDEKYKRKMQAATSALAIQLEDIKKQQASIDNQVREKVDAERDKIWQAACEDAEKKLKESLGTELKLQKDALKVEHEHDISSLRIALEESHKLALDTAVDDWRRHAELSHQTALQDALSVLRAKLEADKKTELDRMVEEHNEAMRNRNMAYEERINYLTASLKQEVVSTKSEVESKLLSERDDLLTSLRLKLDNEYSSRIKQAVEERQGEHTRAVAMMKQQYTDEKMIMVSKYEQDMHAIKLDHEANIKVLHEKITAILASNDVALEEQRVAFVAEVESMKKMHEQVINEVNAQLEHEKIFSSQKIAEMTAESNMALDRQRNQFVTEIETLKLSNDQALQDLTETLRREKESECDRIRSMMDCDKLSIVEGQAEKHRQEMKKALEAQAQDLHDSHAATLELLKAEMEHAEREVAVKQGSIVGSMKEQHAQELRELESRYTVRLSSLETEKYNQLESSRDQILALQSENRKIIEEMELRFKSQLDSVVESQRSEIDAREKEKMALMEARTLSRIAETQEKERENAAAEIGKLRAEKEIMVSSLQEKASADVSNALSSQLSVLLSNHTTELNSLNDRHEEMRRKLEQSFHVAQQDHLREVVGLKKDAEAAVSALTEELEAERSRHAEEIERLHHLHSEEHQKLAAELEQEYQDKARILNEHASYDRDLIERHTSEIDDYKAEIVEIRNKYDSEIKLSCSAERVKYIEALEEQKRVFEELQHDKEKNLTEKYEAELEEQARLSKEKLSDSLVELKNEHEREMRELEIKYNEEETRMKFVIENFERAVDEFKGNENRLSSENQGLQTTISQMSEEHARQCNELNKEWELKMEGRDSDYTSKLKLEVQKVVDQLDSKVAMLQSSHVKECAHLQSTIEELQARYVALEASSESVVEMRRQFESERSAYEESKALEASEMISEMKRNFDKERESMICEHNKELDLLTKANIEELQHLRSILETEKDKYAEEKLEQYRAMTSDGVTRNLAEVKRDHEVALAKLEAAHAERLSALSIEYHHVEADLKREFVKAKAEEIEFLKEKHKSQLEKIENTHSNEIRLLKEEIDRCLIEKATEYETRVEALVKKHSSELSLSMVEQEQEFTRRQQAVEMTVDSNRISELQSQMMELKNLMQSTYDESKMSGPKMEELHQRYLELFKKTSGITSGTEQDDRHLPLPHTRSGSVNNAASAQDANAASQDQTSHMHTDANAYYGNTREAQPMQFNQTDFRNRDGDGDLESYDGMRHSLDSHRSVATSVTWTTRGASDRPSPTDQLIAAILDGDTQGIRSIVRSKGDTLHSPFWIEVTKSILPLHRAISGLHFHGSDMRLVSTIETLIQLGCNVKTVDHVGNSAVHKALQVCTSTSVKSVLEALLAKGASAVARNKVGDAPIHTECRRLRLASPEAISCLLAYGADPSALCAQSTEGGMSKPGYHHEPLDGPNSGVPTSSPLSLVLTTAATMHLDDSRFSVQPSTVDVGKNRESRGDDHLTAKRGAARSWVQVAGVLLRSGVKWDKMWRQTTTGDSQLHLLMQAFPPPRDQAVAYRALLASAVKAGLSPLSCDNKMVRSALHVFCVQLGSVTMESYPDGGNVLHALLHACFDDSVNSGLGKLGARPDSMGRTLFQIQESVPGSWLSASKKLLGEAVSRMSGSNHLRGVLLELQQPKISAYSSDGSRDRTKNNRDILMYTKNNPRDATLSASENIAAPPERGPLFGNRSGHLPPARGEQRRSQTAISSMLLPPR